MKKPMVLAIAGGTCSGKSTLSDYIYEQTKNDYKVINLHMDNYYKNPTPNTIAPITRIEYVEHNHPTALKLDEFYADLDTALNEDNQLIIVEGLFALHLDKIREKSDLKVFVDLDSDQRMQRRIVKHMAWGQTYEEVTNRYIDTVRFRHNELVEPTRWHADMVVNGTLDDNSGKNILLAYLKSIL